MKSIKLRQIQMCYNPVWERWNDNEKYDFLKRHNLSDSGEDLSVIECAKFNLAEIKQGQGHFIEDIEWLKAPLLELKEDDLWNELNKLWSEYLQETL